MEKQYEFRAVLNAKVVKKLAIGIQNVYPKFDSKNFQKEINKTIDQLAFKERAQLIAGFLKKYLPKDYPAAAKILLDSLGSAKEGDKLTGNDTFYYMPHGVYVMQEGLAEEDFEQSMELVYELTKRFTSEWTIRAFLEKYPKRTLKRLAKWVKDKDEHVRRLVSEGTRPRLPWASHLVEFQKNPRPALKLLEQLKEDKSLYVRRSVANHLNDIAKDHPDLVTSTLKEWKKIENEDTQWLIRHALRTLVKAGNADALELLGYAKNPAISISNLKVDKTSLKVGEILVFDFDISSSSKKDQQLMVDYVVHYMKANGKLAPKVFKLKKVALAAEETMHFSKKQSFKLISTRKFHAGKHRIEIQVNGQRFGNIEFELKD
ncbi:MAG: DNA alkylation repair protein [Aureispira sp.]|nr:DNA alkylation repair protein [Aureispira sp.]